MVAVYSNFKMTMNSRSSSRISNKRNFIASFNFMPDIN